MEDKYNDDNFKAALSTLAKLVLEIHNQKMGQFKPNPISNESTPLISNRSNPIQSITR